MFNLVLFLSSNKTHKNQDNTPHLDTLDDFLNEDKNNTKLNISLIVNNRTTETNNKTWISKQGNNNLYDKTNNEDVYFSDTNIDEAFKEFDNENKLLGFNAIYDGHNNFSNCNNELAIHMKE
jgi:hypothetical protein